MPPEFQKIVDQLLHKIQNRFAFIDDIPMVTKGTYEQHMAKVEVMKTLDDAGIRLKRKMVSSPKDANIRFLQGFLQQQVFLFSRPETSPPFNTG